MLCIDAHREAFASRSGFSASILLGRRISQKAAKPGSRHSGRAPNSPGDFCEVTGYVEPLSDQTQNISRFDCEHFAAVGKLTQWQSAASLCKNCGAKKLPVERLGKVYFYSRSGRCASSAVENYRRFFRVYGMTGVTPFPKPFEPEFSGGVRRGKPRLYTSFSAACEILPFPNRLHQSSCIASSGRRPLDSRGRLS